MDALTFTKEHSERIKHKNWRDFVGKPLPLYIIDTLLQSDKINNIYIDYDGENSVKCIKENYSDKRIVLLERPKYLKGEHITANDLIAGILNRIDGEYFIQTHVTCPLLTTKTINEAINMYNWNKPNFDSLFGVTRHQSYFYDFNREPINHSPDQIEKTQDLPPIYEDNSAIYIFDRKCFELWGRIGLNPYMFEINKLEGIDINYPEDLFIAEAVKEKLDADKSYNTSPLSVK